MAFIELVGNFVALFGTTPANHNREPEQIADGEAEGAPVKTGEES